MIKIYNSDFSGNVFEFLSLGKLILFSGLIILSISCRAHIPVSGVQVDSVPSSGIQYQGYRLQIRQIKTEKIKGNKRKINFTLINTGREKITLPWKSINNTHIVFHYDASLQAEGLEEQKKIIEATLLRKKFILDAGKIALGFVLKFEASAADAAFNESIVAQNAKGDNPVTKTEFSEEYCPDLIIDTIFVDKRSRRWVELAFRITNIGKGPAPMFGETEDVEDNVAIRVYSSGTDKLSRGDLVLGGAYIKEGIKDKNGLLLPSESFSGSFRVETRKKTRYTPYFILSVDDYQSLWECDERNNSRFLLDRTR